MKKIITLFLLGFCGLIFSPSNLNAQSFPVPSAIEPILIYTTDTGSEIRVKLAISELKQDEMSERTSVTLYGKKSEIQIPGNLLRIELKGYDPKSFFRFGDITLYRIGTRIFGSGARAITVVRDAAHPFYIFDSGEPGGMKLEKAENGIWQITFSKPVKPGNYALCLKEHIAVCWDFDIIK